MYPNYPNYQNFPTRQFPTGVYPATTYPQVANQPAQFQNPPIQQQFQQVQTPIPQVSAAEKRNKILELYKIVLGRIPQESDISALLNNNFSEIDLIKKMLNSEEHLEILRSRNEIVTSRIENEKIKKEMEELRAKQIDLESTNKSWEELVSEKSEQMRSVSDENKGLNEKVIVMRKRIEGYETRLTMPWWKKVWQWGKKVVGRS